jgi:iron complex transport system ATP-binding protein
MDMARVDGVSFSYNGDRVLHQVTFAVQPGEFMGIIGPNGSGKTTLLRLLEGLLRPLEGEVLIQGVSVREMSRRDMARIVAVVPQESPLTFPFLVQEVVLMGRAPHLGIWEFEGARDYVVACQAMERTRTLDLADRNMNALSGGERQRVLMARALAQEPRLMLLDEPTAFLDIRHQADCFSLMEDLNRQQGLTVVAVTHDINLASLYCHRIILLKEGRIHAVGRPEEVVTEEHITFVYETPVMVDEHPLVRVPRVTPKR